MHSSLHLWRITSPRLLWHTLLSMAVSFLLLGPPTGAAADDPLHVLYVVNFSSNNVFRYTITTNGTLQWQDAVKTGQQPRAIAIHPSGRFVYVRNQGSYDITTYDVDRLGKLTTHPVLLFPAILSDAATGLAIHPSGRSAYVTQYIALSSLPTSPPPQSSLERYTIQGDGTLAFAAQIATGAIPRTATGDPSGQFLYVATQGSATSGVSMYRTDVTNGTVTTILGTVPAGSYPEAVAVHPSGRFAYVVNRGSNTVSMYTIEATSGRLLPQGQVAAGAYAHAITMHPSGRFAYVVNHDANNISEYTIEATGQLIPQGVVAAGTHPYALAFDPTGAFAYGVNFNSNNVAIYTMGPNGQLTLQGFVGAGSGPVATVAFAP